MNIPAKQLKESTCPYCGVGCGIDVSIANDGETQTLLSVEGNKQHPANFGRLCIKGQSLLETTQAQGRLTTPYILGEERSWDEASTWVANKLTTTIAKHGKDSVAFYVSGQLLTEDYYVANKLMKGFIGSANIDTNSRLCMSSAVAAYKRAFGEDLVPCCYEDLEKTDVLILIGSNAAWTHPVLFGRIERAKLANPNLRIIQVDPRKTASSSIVDIHLPIKPGTDAALFNGLLAYIGEYALDAEFVKTHTNGFDDALLAAKTFTPQNVASICDVALEDVLAFFDTFAQSNSAISFYSMGINQSTSGVDKANAIINCHLASGKIGKIGSGPFSITGQPNAMGGREVGGLANMLAAHMSIENPTHRDIVSDFWQTTNLATTAGLSAVDLFNAIDEGSVKFIWIMGTNPVASMPNRAKIEAALAKCDTVVVSEVVTSNDTLRFAHAALPAAPWSEKDGTVTNSERCISRQKSLMPPLGNAKPDWQIMCDVAIKMGFSEAFSFETPSQIFNEHAALTAYKNDGSRALNLSGLAALSEHEYETLSPIQWPVHTSETHKLQGQKRLFENKQFFTTSKRAQFIAIEPRLPKQLTSKDFPFVLNTGRMRDQWHTMTRTGNAANLHQHTPIAYLYIHPMDASELSLKEYDLVEVNAAFTSNGAGKNTGNGKVILPIQLDANLRRNTLFAPIHWTNEWASNASIAWLFSSDNDPISGQPELKHAAVSVQKSLMPARASVASRRPLDREVLVEMCDYWTCVKQDSCFVYDMGSFTPSVTWLEQLKATYSQDTIFYEYKNQTTAQHTCALVQGETLVMLLQISAETSSTHYEWLNSLFTSEFVSKDISSALRFTPSPAFLNGKMICSCHQVRELTIKEAIIAGTNTVDGLGVKLKCGTNCGSCKGELANLIETTVSNIKPLHASKDGVGRETTVEAALANAATGKARNFENEALIPTNIVEASKV